MLETKDIQFSYQKGRPVLRKVNVQIEIGKIVVLAGENGSGKSTILKILANLLQPQSGQVWLNGSEVTRTSLSEIAFMPDDQLYHPYLTGEQLFTFLASQFRDFEWARAKKIADYLRVDITTKVSVMSKGNISRLKLAAVFGRKARYYLLDEPFSGLDPLVREEIIKSIIQFVDLENATILLSTHELDDVSRVADELMILKDGEITAHESLENIRSECGMEPKEWFKSFYKKGRTKDE
ncbi:ABC transporter ATP-binding protein [Neobacillus mesonae]|uniref:ABC transporter ATP-binding protein n=1 Tax=Neobacillus mesonae TaxID=1193713 RepID=UPI002E22AA26|nr:ABC transporter ATP-binding protein [Neobacillus mesonae]